MDEQSIFNHSLSVGQTLVGHNVLPRSNGAVKIPWVLAVRALLRELRLSYTLCLLSKQDDTGETQWLACMFLRQMSCFRSQCQKWLMGTLGFLAWSRSVCIVGHSLGVWFQARWVGCNCHRVRWPIIHLCDSLCPE